MAIIFNGKEYALKKKLLLQSSSDKVREFGVIPHLATILIGDNPASKLYVDLKKKFIESLKCELDVYLLTQKTNFSEIELLIKTLNEDETVHGIMVQLPLPSELGIEKAQIVELIKDEKDIDGLKENSKFLHPTSKAILEVLAMAIYETRQEVITACVVGSNGMVGRPLVKELKKLGYIVHECNKDTQDLKEKTIGSDVVISATGVMNLITKDMITDGTIVIDAGSPNGDVESDVESKASFITPVPGGVGPVTITCLAENLIVAAQSTINSIRDAK